MPVIRIGHWRLRRGRGQEKVATLEAMRRRQTVKRWLTGELGPGRRALPAPHRASPGGQNAGLKVCHRWRKNGTSPGVTPRVLWRCSRKNGPRPTGLCRRGAYPSDYRMPPENLVARIEKTSKRSGRRPRRRRLPDGGCRAAGGPLAAKQALRAPARLDSSCGSAAGLFWARSLRL